MNKNSSTVYDILLDGNGGPSEALLNLLDACRISHDGTLEGIVHTTQRLWYHSSDVVHTYSNGLLTFLKQIGFIEERAPRCDSYSSGIILGTHFAHLQIRFDYIVEQWKRGVRFSKLLFLAGERYRGRSHESLLDIFDIEGERDRIGKRPLLSFDAIPKTETELAKIIYNYADLPKEFAQIPVTFIHALGYIDAQGNHHRPTTVENVTSWLETNPEGNNLIVSNQPYVLYQESVFFSYLPDHIEFEMVGPAAHPDYPLKNIMGSLARALFTLFKTSLNRGPRI